MARRMADPAYRAQQYEQRYAPHIATINEFCDSLRQAKPGHDLPYVDPVHDLDGCRIVSLFAHPGAAAGSGFISAENDDDGAARIVQVYQHVGLRPEDRMPWNAYPWYLSGQESNKLTKEQLAEGLKPLLRFLTLLPRASALVAHGAEAHKLARQLLKLETRTIRSRGFKVYEVRATTDRAFTGSPDKQQLWLDEMHTAYSDAMARTGISASFPSAQDAVDADQDQTNLR